MGKQSPTSGWTQTKVSDRGATFRRTIDPSQTPPDPATFAPKPLSIAQLNCIDQLVLGCSEREVAEACGVDRGTIATWRKVPLFVATLNERRQALWSEAQGGSARSS
jgi:hypothetical protein